jgi:hypothetical protein
LITTRQGERIHVPVPLNTPDEQDPAFQAQVMMKLLDECVSNFGPGQLVKQGDSNNYEWVRND